MNVRPSIGECRMAPQHVASARVLHRLQQPGFADLLETFWRQASQNQFPLVVPHKNPVFLLNKKHCCKRPGFSCHRVAFPETFACFCLETTQLASAAKSVNVITVPYRSGHRGMQAVIEM